MTNYSAPRFAAAPLPMPPRYRFRPVGDVRSATFVSKSPLRSIKNPGSHTAAQKAGKRFEKKLLSRLDSTDDYQVLKAPWIQYEVSEAGPRWCQPDALISRKTDVLIVEAKLTHTADAYWQLRQLYEPIVKWIFPKAVVHLVEVTRSFDPAVRMPEEMVLFFDLVELLKALPATAKPEVYVLQWKL
jgi:hypothetical protein